MQMKEIFFSRYRETEPNTQGRPCAAAVRAPRLLPHEPDRQVSPGRHQMPAATSLRPRFRLHIQGAGRGRHREVPRVRLTRRGQRRADGILQLSCREKSESAARSTEATRSKA